MRIWIGLKQDEEYVHEWVGELSEDDDIADAVKGAISKYIKASGKPIWGMTIMVDKNRGAPDLSIGGSCFPTLSPFCKSERAARARRAGK